MSIPYHQYRYLTGKISKGIPVKIKTKFNNISIHSYRNAVRALHLPKGDFPVLADDGSNIIVRGTKDQPILIIE